MPLRARVLLPVSTLAATALALAGCAPADEGNGAGLSIVTSTNVYGDLAATIAGDAAEVTAIIHDSAQDPHEYEATPRDALAIAEADLVVVNGGGHDEFMATLLAAPDTRAVVVAPREPPGPGPGQHDEGEHE